MRTTTPNGLTPRQLVEREERVFPTYPQVSRYFPAAAIEDARQRLGRAIERGDGPGLVIGGPGTGKSLLLQVLAAQFHEKFDVVLPACARLCTRRALLQAILFELGLPYRVRDEGDLRLSLLDHLLSREECPTGLLLLVDEAQTLSTALLDELRVLTNLVRGGLPRVRLVLAGSSALEECFAHPDLESFSQRLAARCYLAPLGREETIQFIRAQVAAAGAGPDELLANDAWDAVFEATDGVQRLVNQLCDRSLMKAGERNRLRIDRATVQAAWADIQQLPAPWETPPPTTEPPAPLQVVEFGQLDERAESPQTAAPSFDELIAASNADEEDALDVDSTELDFEEASVETQPVAAQTSEQFVVQPAANNPFMEEFAEEEVVLDNFANWDNMFRREAPRVENRRDPEFASLVQAAITTAESDKDSVIAESAPLRMARPENHGPADSVETVAPSSEKSNRKTVEWPPLRIAVVSDSSPSVLESDYVPTPATPPAAAWNMPQDDSATWSRQEMSAALEQAAHKTLANEEEPVLIVEDDTPTPKAPVRHEEYRNLFSRLRSG